MLTQIWLPNIDPKGPICHNYLKVDPAFGEGAGYSPILGISGVVLGVLTLFYGGENPDDPLNNEAALQYKNSKATFEKKAREWTEQYAKPVSIKAHCLPSKEPIEEKEKEKK